MKEWKAAFISDVLYLFGQGSFFFYQGKLREVFKSCACGNHVAHVRNSPQYLEKRKGFSFTILITTKFKLKLKNDLIVFTDLHVKKLEVHKRKTVTKESTVQ